MLHVTLAYAVRNSLKYSYPLERTKVRGFGQLLLCKKTNKQTNKQTKNIYNNLYCSSSINQVISMFLTKKPSLICLPRTVNSLTLAPFCTSSRTMSLRPNVQAANSAFRPTSSFSHKIFSGSLLSVAKRRLSPSTSPSKAHKSTVFSSADRIMT